MKNLFKTLSILVITSIIVNANAQESCTGCEMTIISNKPSRVSPQGPSISFGALKITDALTDSCAGNPNQSRTLAFRFYAFGSGAATDCNANTTNCSETKCAIDFEYAIQIIDLSASGGNEPCVLKGAKPWIKFKYNNWIDTISTNKLLNVHENENGLYSIATLPFEQSCGDSNTLNLSADITYLTKRVVGDTFFIEPKVVVYNFNNTNIKCETCEEETNTDKRISEINNKKLHKIVSVYPNPVDNKINFTFNTLTTSNAFLQITNIVGQSIYNNTTTFNKGENNLSIDVSNLTNGVYQYKLIINEVPKYGKFIVQH